MNQTMQADLSALAAGARDGDRRSLARVLTLVENGSAAGEELSRELAGLRSSRVVVGFTGAPGVGKSTLVNAVTGELRRHGSRVAVVAVDPSSPRGGGALLGDRLRMIAHNDDNGVFIRSFASRGHLGGLSAALPACIAILAAAPFDWLLIETVGVGQSEVDVCNLADVTVVVTAPGMGDGVQADKAGLNELADVFVVNKADLPDAAKTVGDLRQMLAIGASHDPDAWRVPIIKTDSLHRESIDEVVQAVEQRVKWLTASGVEIDRDRSQRRLLEDAIATVRKRLADPRGRAVLVQAAQDLEAGRVRPEVLSNIFTFVRDRQTALLRSLQTTERT